MVIFTLQAVKWAFEWSSDFAACLLKVFLRRPVVRWLFTRLPDRTQGRSGYAGLFLLDLEGYFRGGWRMEFAVFRAS